jgi:uncharacterized protein (DUF58 family)
VGLFVVNNGPILLSIPLLIYLGFAIANQTSEPLLKTSRELSTHDTSWGKPVEVKVNVTNQGKPLEEIFLQDYVRGSRPLNINQGFLTKRLCLDKGETTSLDYIVSGERGRYKFEGVQVKY